MYPKILLLSGLLLLAACDRVEKPKEIERSFYKLSSWQQTTDAQLVQIFEKMCAKPAGNAWLAWCTDLPTQTDKVRAYAEETLQPTEIVSHDSKFTGYYTPELQGSRVPTQQFNVPLRAYPNDLITLRLQDFDAELPAKTLRGKLVGNWVKPYPERSQIEAGEAEADALLWLADATDKFFLQIQGSGVVTTPKGEHITVGYAADNGRQYTAIGKVLLDKGELQLPVSMDSIKNWLEQHPTRANEVMNTNPRYIFFRELEGKPRGAYNAELAAGSSLAVDPSITPLGTPVLVETTQTATNTPWQRLMLAEDVGSAIVGSVRGDIYFGVGDEAAANASSQNSAGRLIQLRIKPKV